MPLKRTWLILALIALALLLAAAFAFSRMFAVSKVSIPRWSIGLYRARADFEIAAAVSNPVFKAAELTASSAYFVADPYVFVEQGIYYMFYENGMITETGWKGVINLAISRDAVSWEDKGIVLQDKVSLSFPAVHSIGGGHYMTVDGSGAGNLRLFTATDFPYHWSCTDTLLVGKWADPAVWFENGTYYLFASVPGKHDAHLFFGDTIAGPYKEHPASPIVTKDKSRGRNAGQIFRYGRMAYRPVQDCAKLYGESVRLMEILELTRSAYRERESEHSPVLTPGGKGWNSVKMHTFNPFEIREDGFSLIVDGTYVDYEHQYRLRKRR